MSPLLDFLSFPLTFLTFFGLFSSSEEELSILVGNLSDSDLVTLSFFLILLFFDLVLTLSSSEDSLDSDSELDNLCFLSFFFYFTILTLSESDSLDTDVDLERSCFVFFFLLSFFSSFSSTFFLSCFFCHELVKQKIH